MMQALDKAKEESKVVPTCTLPCVSLVAAKPAAAPKVLKISLAGKDDEEIEGKFRPTKSVVAIHREGAMVAMSVMENEIAIMDQLIKQRKEKKLPTEFLVTKKENLEFQKNVRTPLVRILIDIGNEYRGGDPVACQISEAAQRGA